MISTGQPFVEEEEGDLEGFIEEEEYPEGDDKAD